MPESSVQTIFISIAKKLGTVGVVYLLGKYDLSIAWLICPVILSVVREEWKREKDLKRNIAKATAMSSEKEVILARVDELPSWVFFPDVERAEWLNKIFKQVWPNVNNYTKALLKDTIEPSVRDALAAYKLTGFSFDRIGLGSIPVRISGVKVYDKNVSRNEIIMDLEIFYGGDCDISFFLSGMKAGIKDFQLHGMCRVIMKPLISTIPLVGGLQVFFLNNPTIDFNLVGIADMLDMPGLSEIIRRTIVEQVAALMVLPNKLPIILSDAVPATELKTPEPEGVLRIHVVEAKDLMKKDISLLGKGKSDPYTVLNIGAQQFRTQTIENNVNPKWDYWCECVVFDARGQQLCLQLYDADDLSKKDEKLGRATVDVNHVIRKGEVDLWVTLEDAKHGMLHLRLTWLKLSDNAADLQAAVKETQLLRVTSMSSAVLTVFLDACKNIKQVTPHKKPDVYVVLTVNKKTEQTTPLRSCDPVFEQGYTFLVNQPRTDSLFVKVMDMKTGQLLGQLEQPLLAMLEMTGLEIKKQPFTLKKGTAESRIEMSMQLKILKREVSGEAAGSDEDAAAESAAADVDLSKPLLQSQASIKSQASLKSQGSIKSQGSVKRIDTLSKQSSTQSTNSASSQLDEPVLTSAANYDTDASPEIRHRNNSTASSAGEFNLGRIQLTLRYSSQRQRLIVVVHRITNLPLKDPSNIPDPYVKFYLLPDRKDSKRKTETVKDNCNPVYDETIEYVISLGELNSRQLEVSVVTKKGWSASVMGQVMVNLADLDLAQALTLWYDLTPEIPRDS